MENKDNVVYYNIWNVDTDNWLLSKSVDYLRFENIENENDFSILIVDSETIYLVDKNNKEKGGGFPCEYQPNHIELQDKVTINAKDYRTDELYDIVTLMNKDKEECIVRANDNDNNSLFDELKETETENDKLVSLLNCIKEKGMPKQVIICSENAVRAYSEIKKLEIKDKKLFIENCLCEFNNDEQVHFIY